MTHLPADDPAMLRSHVVLDLLRAAERREKRWRRWRARIGIQLKRPDVPVAPPEAVTDGG